MGKNILALPHCWHNRVTGQNKPAVLCTLCTSNAIRVFIHGSLYDILPGSHMQLNARDSNVSIWYRTRSPGRSLEKATCRGFHFTRKPLHARQSHANKIWEKKTFCVECEWNFHVFLFTALLVLKVGSCIVTWDQCTSNLTIMDCFSTKQIKIWHVKKVL